MLEILVANHHTASNSEVTLNFHYVHSLFITAFPVFSAPTYPTFQNYFRLLLAVVRWHGLVRIDLAVCFSEIPDTLKASKS
jgi:hypothetical protein